LGKPGQQHEEEARRVQEEQQRKKQQEDYQNSWDNLNKPYQSGHNDHSNSGCMLVLLAIIGIALVLYI
jgi:hypothetical protein